LEDEVSVHLNKFGEVYNVPLGEEFAIQEYSAVAVAGKDSSKYAYVLQILFLISAKKLCTTM